MGETNYDQLKAKSHRASLKSQTQKELEAIIRLGFPNCKGSYPDCPEHPNKEELPCRTCPVLDED
jgi:hypothetical protein